MSIIQSTVLLSEAKDLRNCWSETVVYFLDKIYSYLGLVLSYYPRLPGPSLEAGGEGTCNIIKYLCSQPHMTVEPITHRNTHNNNIIS